MGLVHAMAHPLGAHLHLPHGLACALLMPPVMHFNLPACPERYADMALQLGEDLPGSATDRGAAAVRAVERLLSNVGIRRELQAGSVTDALAGRMADESIQSGMHLTNPSLRMVLSYSVFVVVLIARPHGLFAR